MEVQSILNTSLCKKLNIKYPIIQAGMGFLARAELAAAVSNAGGLGIVGAGALSAEEFHGEVKKVKNMTDKPFGVDILFATMPKTEETKVAQYTQLVQEHIDAAFQENVPIIAAGLGNPAQIVPEAHAKGIKVMALVGNVKNALRVAASRVDIVVAQGHEAGGHTGRIGSLALIPLIVDAVKVPVVAAGGIADGRGLVAALALGACGVWMGTRFVATKEAFCHINYKNRIAEIDEEGTVITRCYTGKPCRVIKNSFTEEWKNRESEILPYPLQQMKIGMDVWASGRREGKIDVGSCAAGQISGMIRDVVSAAEVISQLMSEAEQVLEKGLSSR
ncbi:MAG: nitronate monooxygenase [Candidatus Tectomicrobia bacterium]|uniref:Nitronate monooxygenase n=1 Tax=Tectimicrobiota bacterium TaxID=2528274 RepID=A0A933GJV8_UNCTE|nr:nitronate monooxygenase [Candidatus Tectomicrobia bacterium]